MIPGDGLILAPTEARPVRRVVPVREFCAAVRPPVREPVKEAPRA